MRHDGTHSVLRCLCTDVEAEALEAELKQDGRVVRTNSPRETSEQTVERNNLFAVFNGEDNVWPTAKCPECTWFDPFVEGRCGAGKVAPELLGWGSEAVEIRLRDEKAARDYGECPLGSTAGGLDG